jgi:hypothetical protein
MDRRTRVASLATAVLLATTVWFVSSAPAEARPKHPPDNGVRCVYHNQQTGEMEFYLPGQNIFVNDANGDYVMLTCGDDGNWHSKPATRK